MIKKTITLPKEQINYINKERKRYGMSFSEYLRRLIVDNINQTK